MIGNIHLFFPERPDNFVQCIKSVRALSGHGLKDSKQICDTAVGGSSSFQVGNHDMDDTMAHLRTLRKYGEVTVDGQFDHYITALQELVTAAVMAGDYYVARSIIETLETRFAVEKIQRNDKNDH